MYHILSSESINLCWRIQNYPEVQFQQYIGVLKSKLINNYSFYTYLRYISIGMTIGCKTHKLNGLIVFLLLCTFLQWMLYIIRYMCVAVIWHWLVFDFMMFLKIREWYIRTSTFSTFQNNVWTKFPSNVKKSLWKVLQVQTWLYKNVKLNIKSSKWQLEFFQNLKWHVSFPCHT